MKEQKSKLISFLDNFYLFEKGIISKFNEIDERLLKLEGGGTTLNNSEQSNFIEGNIYNGTISSITFDGESWIWQESAYQNAYIGLEGGSNVYNAVVRIGFIRNNETIPLPQVEKDCDIIFAFREDRLRSIRVSKKSADLNPKVVAGNELHTM